MAAKYGLSPAQVRAGHDRLTALGAEVGMVFDFERVQLGSTFDAHRLAQAARGHRCEEALVKKLFAAHFTEGRQLSDHQVLREVAAVGRPPRARHREGARERRLRRRRCEPTRRRPRSSGSPGCPSS